MVGKRQVKIVLRKSIELVQTQVHPLKIKWQNPPGEKNCSKKKKETEEKVIV